MLDCLQKVVEELSGQLRSAREALRQSAGAGGAGGGGGAGGAGAALGAAPDHSQVKRPMYVHTCFCSFTTKPTNRSTISADTTYILCVITIALPCYALGSGSNIYLL